MTKLIVTDVDGTLLGRNGEITLETKEAVRQIREVGMDITLATGRCPTTCNWIVDELNIEQPIITHNGGSIFDPVKQEYLYYQGFSSAKLKSIINDCKTRNIYFYLVTKEKMLIEKECETIFFNYFPDAVPLAVVDDLTTVNDPCVKMGIISTDKEVQGVWSYLKQTYANWYIVSSAETGIDIHDGTINKGEGLKRLANIVGVRPEQMISFGNYYNDIELLQYAGLGVAVNNAPDFVKKNANKITSSHDNSGVAKFISQFVEKTVI